MNLCCCLYLYGKYLQGVGGNVCDCGVVGELIRCPNVWGLEGPPRDNVAPCTNN